jgi:hypothetical protein
VASPNAGGTDSSPYLNEGYQKPPLGACRRGLAHPYQRCYCVPSVWIHCATFAAQARYSFCQFQYWSYTFMTFRLLYLKPLVCNPFRHFNSGATSDARYPSHERCPHRRCTTVLVAGANVAWRTATRFDQDGSIRPSWTCRTRLRDAGLSAGEGPFPATSPHPTLGQAGHPSLHVGPSTNALRRGALAEGPHGSQAPSRPGFPAHRNPQTSPAMARGQMA